MARRRDSLSAKALAPNDGHSLTTCRSACLHPIRKRLEGRQSRLCLVDRALHDHGRSAEAYEIVGVLREVFGIADHDLAIFCEGDGSRFQIDADLPATGVVSSPLRLLAETRRQIEGQSLFNAVKILVEQTQLQQRLASLPQEEFADLKANSTICSPLPLRRNRAAIRWLNSLKKFAWIFSCNATCDVDRRWHPTDHCAKGERFRMAGCYPAVPRSGRNSSVATISRHHKSSRIDRSSSGPDQGRFSG